MSHYTLTSGRMTRTYSAVCPICRVRRTFEGDDLPGYFVPPLELCCSKEHEQSHFERIVTTALAVCFPLMAETYFMRAALDGVLIEKMSRAFQEQWAQPSQAGTP